jgi:hypothetical protein
MSQKAQYVALHFFLIKIIVPDSNIISHDYDMIKNAKDCADFKTPGNGFLEV